jgi:hypothetical protein
VPKQSARLALEVFGYLVDATAEYLRAPTPRSRSHLRVAWHYLTLWCKGGLG